MKIPKPDLSNLRRGGGGFQPRVPDFAMDVYRDLRDRRLLPFVALLAVAILAVPFLLGGGSDESPEPGPVEIEALQEGSANTSALTVVEAQPGLRDYRRRLKGRQATNPFKQRYTSPELKGAKLNEPKGQASTEGGSGASQTSTGGESGSSGPTVETPTGGSVPSSPPAGNGGGNQGGGGKGGSPSSPGAAPPLTYYTFAVDVTIVHASGSSTDGDKSKSEPEERHRVLATTPLPGKKVEVVNYIGLSPKTRKPLFVVSDQVTGVFGEGHCVSGTEVCSLIELEQGFPETFVYGEDGDRYKIKVTGIETVATGHSK
jgi:hypothetical protein